MRFALLVFAVTGFAGGCQRSSLTLVPVEGRITFDGGEWPKPGMLYFAAKTPAKNSPYKPGTARFQTDGRFRVTTLDEGDGLVPGTYVVNVECWEVPPMMAPGAPAGKSYVPEQYQSGIRSGFLVEVPADASGPVVVSLDIPRS